MGFQIYTGGRGVLANSASATVKMGPFIDTNGDAVTTLTIAQADVRLSKNDAAFAQKSNSSSASHVENGWYDVPLDPADIDITGNLIIAIHASGALPVWRMLEVDVAVS